MATRSEQIASTKIRQYDVYFGGVLLGFTTPDSTSANIPGVYSDLEVDQIPGIVKSTNLGFPITIDASLYDVSPEGIAILLEGQVTSNTDGLNTNIEFGITKAESQEYAKELLLHPSGIDLSDRTGDIKIFKAYAKAENIQLQSSKTTYQSVTVQFVAQPDLNNADSKVYGILGDPSLDQVTPIANYVALDGDARAPYKSATAATIAVSTKERLNGVIVNGLDSGETLDANGAIGATVTALVFDALTSDNILVEGSVIKNVAEYMYVESVVYVTATTGTATVVRGAFGTTAASILDNDTMEIYQSVSYTQGRDFVSWSSATPATATIGDTYAGSGAANKAVITGVAAGTTDITFTWNAVTSPVFTLTVA